MHWTFVQSLRVIFIPLQLKPYYVILPKTFYKFQAFTPLYHMDTLQHICAEVGVNLCSANLEANILEDLRSDTTYRK